MYLSVPEKQSVSAKSPGSYVTDLQISKTLGRRIISEFSNLSSGPAHWITTTQEAPVEVEMNTPDADQLINMEDPAPEKRSDTSASYHQVPGRNDRFQRQSGWGRLSSLER